MKVDAVFRGLCVGVKVKVEVERCQQLSSVCAVSSFSISRDHGVNVGCAWHGYSCYYWRCKEHCFLLGRF